MARNFRLRMIIAPAGKAPLQLLSVVIPARDEAGCIAATVEHLHVELRLHNVPHEIIVVDDGSTDNTWDVWLKLGNESKPCDQFKIPMRTDSVVLLFSASIMPA